MQRFSLSFVGESLALRADPVGPWIRLEDAIREFDRLNDEIGNWDKTISRLKETIADQAERVARNAK